MKHTSDGFLDLNETIFLLRGSIQEIEKLHKQNEVLKNENIDLKNTITKEMEQLVEAVSGS
jgi:cell division protein FtsB